MGYGTSKRTSHKKNQQDRKTKPTQVFLQKKLKAKRNR